MSVISCTVYSNSHFMTFLGSDYVHVFYRLFIYVLPLNMQSIIREVLRSN